LSHFSQSHPSRSPKDSDSHSIPAEPKKYEEYLKKDEENLEEYYKEEEKNAKEKKNQSSLNSIQAGRAMNFVPKE
jgi:hypothetical protein